MCTHVAKPQPFCQLSWQKCCHIISVLNPMDVFQGAGSYTSHQSIMWHISLKAPHLLCLSLLLHSVGDMCQSLGWVVYTEQENEMTENNWYPQVIWNTIKSPGTPWISSTGIKRHLLSQVLLGSSGGQCHSLCAQYSLSLCMKCHKTQWKEPVQKAPTMNLNEILLKIISTY